MLLVETYFIWFVCYSVLGWVYETILCSTLERRFISRGFLNGPYCPIYGFGAILVIAVLGDVDNIAALFLSGVVLTCSLEYVTSWGMEKLFHARWWDYSDKKWNINGRICLLGAVAFGSFSVLLIKGIHPPVAQLIGRIPRNFMHYGSLFLFLLLLADSFYTILSVSDFDQKLKELSAEIAGFTDGALHRYAETLKERVGEKELHEKISHAYERFRSRMNAQEHRMLKAFPAFRSMRYNKHLQEIRAAVKKLKERNRNH